MDVEVLGLHEAQFGATVSDALLKNQENGIYFIYIFKYFLWLLLKIKISMTMIAD